MGAGNVLMFILVWTFTAVCHANDEMSVNCEDVTGTVRKEVTLTCSVSQKKSGCCFTVYKFLYPEKYNDPTICKEFPQDSCEQRNSFTCRFTPTTVMTEQFRFFIVTECGWERTEFTVDITETSKHEPVTEDPEHSKHLVTEDPGLGYKAIINNVVGSVIVSFILAIVIIGATVFHVIRVRRNYRSGFQMNYERGASAEPTMRTVNAQSETR